MTINCKGKLLDLSTPKIMGILNLTPDSFYDGGKYKSENQIVNQVKSMLAQGATFIDVGAYSSRPGASHIEAQEELRRIIPMVTLLLKTFPNILLSIDTFRSKVADACLTLGAAIINDISAGSLDANMFCVVAKHRAPYIMMHMKGTPSNMQDKTNYKDIISEMCYYFSEKIAQARTLGINDIIIDPGFGFAKSLEQNYEILNKLELLHTIKLPILAGISRKSMIYKLLDTTPDNALNGSTALHMYALTKGAHILRVHDVKEAVECVQLFKAIHATTETYSNF